MDSLYSVWKNKRTMDGTGFSLAGESIAGIRTSFYCPELKVQLDAGFQNFNKVTDIFITHTHADHIASLPLILLENISNKIETKIYCPRESLSILGNMIDSFLVCNYNNSQIPKKYYRLIGVDTKYYMDLRFNNQDIKLESFYSSHTVPTLSYGFTVKQKKLKEEYIGFDKKDLVSIKNSGGEITHIVEYKKFVFCGDTDITIFKNNPKILDYPNIVIECTFFDKEDLQSAIDRKHMHWEQLKVVVKENSNIMFYLIHISAKHKDKTELFSIIKEFNNVIIL